MARNTGPIAGRMKIVRNPQQSADFLPTHAQFMFKLAGWRV
jgi:hypothetical protein